MFPVIWKPVDWFAMQTNWLVSILRGTLVNNGLKRIKTVLQRRDVRWDCFSALISLFLLINKVFMRKICFTTVIIGIKPIKCLDFLHYTVKLLIINNFFSVAFSNQIQTRNAVILSIILDTGWYGIEYSLINTKIHAKTNISFPLT